MITYLVIVEPAADGQFSARCPQLPGCTAAGTSLENATQLLGTAMQAHLDLLRERGEPIPAPNQLVPIEPAGNPVHVGIARLY